jgi:C-terminal processing protease CtpA/Prc
MSSFKAKNNNCFILKKESVCLYNTFVIVDLRADVGGFLQNTLTFNASFMRGFVSIGIIIPKGSLFL